MIGQKKIVLFDIDYTLFDTGLFKESSLTDFRLYEEILEVLEEIAPVATIGIFSEGEKDFQLTKLIQTNIRDYFNDEHVHIFTKKLAALADVLLKYKGDRVYFIDDKPDVLQGIKDSDPTIYTIWVKRGEYSEAYERTGDFKPDSEVIDLREIVNLITKG